MSPEWWLPGVPTVAVTEGEFAALEAFDPDLMYQIAPPGWSRDADGRLVPE